MRTTAPYAEMAAATAGDRPHRASGEQAARVVDILEAVVASMADDERPVTIASTFIAPPLMGWA